MSSKTQIVNLALQRIGVSQQVANVDTENSRNALSAKIIFDQERDAVLAAFEWPFATRYVSPALVAGSGTVPLNNDWIFSYRYPVDALSIRRIVSVLGRRDIAPAAFRIGSDVAGRLIYTSIENAEIEYTARVTDPESFDPIFVSAFAWKLAASLAPALSRISNVAVMAMQLYELDLSKAKAQALNEGENAAPPDAEWIRSR